MEEYFQYLKTSFKTSISSVVCISPAGVVLHCYIEWLGRNTHGLTKAEQGSLSGIVKEIGL